MYRINAIAVTSIRTPRGPEGEQQQQQQQQQTPPPTPPVTPPVTPQEIDIGGIKFSLIQQQKVNALLADERRKQEQANRTLVSELEQLKQSTGMTEQEKANLQARIEELQATYTTKEQQQQTEYQKLDEKYKKDTTKLQESLKGTTQQLHNKYKQVDLTEAANHYKAISAKQVVTMLWEHAVVEEALDENGKPTGELVTRINFTGKDKEGNPVKLKLSPRDAVKAMTEMPDEYGNLFENTSRGGLGQGGNQANAGGNGRIPNLENMTVEDYRKHRPQIRQEMAKQQ